MSDRINQEYYGVYYGVLVEDMIDTVSRVKMPYVDVLLDNFEEGDEYPLTYVPVSKMVLPLKKGEEVYVVYNQGNPSYPVLYKMVNTFDEESDLVSGGVGVPENDTEYEEEDKVKVSAVEFNEGQKTLSVNMLMEGVYLVVAEESDDEGVRVSDGEGYVMLHSGDKAVLFTRDGNVYVNVGDMCVRSVGKVKNEYNDLEELVYGSVKRVVKGAVEELVKGEVKKYVDSKFTLECGDDVDVKVAKLVSMLSDGEIKFMSKRDVTAEVDGLGKVTIQNKGVGQNKSLGTILSGLINEVSSATYVGSAGPYAMNPANIAKLSMLNADVNFLLG